ncbi:MAG: hypothetical protein FWE82_05945 [Defluviitaleaceae bacterium]|nr:hypothetical protein [Defluviitaleaceae bacterium]
MKYMKIMCAILLLVLTSCRIESKKIELSDLVNQDEVSSNDNYHNEIGQDDFESSILSGTIDIIVPSGIFQEINDMARIFMRKHDNVIVNVKALKNYLTGNPEITSITFDEYKDHKRIIVQTGTTSLTMSAHIDMSNALIFESYVDTLEQIDYMQNDYAKEIENMLLTNTAPDIFVAPKDYFLYDVGIHSYLVNVYELMENDSTFDYNDYFINIIDAFAVNDMLYEFPINFCYHYIAVNSNANNELIDLFTVHKNTINWFELYEFGNSNYAYINNNEMGIYHAYHTDMVQFTFNSLLEYKRGLNNLNDKKYLNLLKEIAENMQTKDAFERWDFVCDVSIRNNENLSEWHGKYLFLRIPHNAFQYFVPTAEGKGHEFIQPLPYTDDKSRVILTADQTAGNIFQIRLCINEKSENKQLAWEFTKFMTQPEAYGKRNAPYRAIEPNHVFMGNHFASINKQTYADYLTYALTGIIANMSKSNAETHRYAYMLKNMSDINVIEKEIINKVETMQFTYVPVYFNKSTALMFSTKYEDNLIKGIYKIYENMLVQRNVNEIIPYEKWINNDEEN